MFDVAWSEILVVLVVAILIVKPEDVPQLIDFARKMMRKFSFFKNEARGLYHEMEKEFDEIKDDFTLIKNDEGEEFKSYDISELMELKSTKPNAKNDENENG